MRSSLKTKVLMMTTFWPIMEQGPNLVLFEQRGPLFDMASHIGIHAMVPFFMWLHERGAVLSMVAWEMCGLKHYHLMQKTWQTDANEALKVRWSSEEICPTGIIVFFYYNIFFGPIYRRPGVFMKFRLNFRHQNRFLIVFRKIGQI